MPLPVNARIEAANTFVRNVQAIRTALQQQDSATAEIRYATLLARLSDARERLRWNPAAGRPARFLKSHSARDRIAAKRAENLAVALGVSELRELVMKPYVLLYAHATDRVVLLALKHERQLIFEFK